MHPTHIPVVQIEPLALARSAADLVAAVVSLRLAGTRLAFLPSDDGDREGRLQGLGLRGLFDAAHHLSGNDLKSGAISGRDSVLIDDRFSERCEVADACAARC